MYVAFVKRDFLKDWKSYDHLGREHLPNHIYYRDVLPTGNSEQLIIPVLPTGIEESITGTSVDVIFIFISSSSSWHLGSQNRKNYNSIESIQQTGAGPTDQYYR